MDAREIINFHPKERKTNFSKETKDLEQTLERLKSRKEELDDQLFSYDSDDRLRLEQDYNNVIRDIIQVNLEIKRRMDNN